MRVRRLRADEWREWRALRLRALADAPYAFATTFAESTAWPDEQWIARTADFAAPPSALFVAEAADDGWLGCAGCFVEDNGRAHVISVWSAPEARGRGVGRATVNAVLDWLHDCGHERAYLWVTTTNDAARRLYDTLGFTPTGASQPLPSDPSLTEVEMALDLVRRRLADEPAARS